MLGLGKRQAQHNGAPQLVGEEGGELGHRPARRRTAETAAPAATRAGAAAGGALGDITTHSPAPAPDEAAYSHARPVDVPVV